MNEPSQYLTYAKCGTMCRAVGFTICQYKHPETSSGVVFCDSCLKEMDPHDNNIKIFVLLVSVACQVSIWWMYESLANLGWEM